ncbi:hypothetical protein ABG768_000064, partial [Culter alburnus]
RSGLLTFTPSSAPTCQSSENTTIKLQIKQFACETTLKTRLSPVRAEAGLVWQHEAYKICLETFDHP